MISRDVTGSVYYGASGGFGYKILNEAAYLMRTLSNIKHIPLHLIRSKWMVMDANGCPECGSDSGHINSETTAAGINKLRQMQIPVSMHFSLRPLQLNDTPAAKSIPAPPINRCRWQLAIAAKRFDQHVVHFHRSPTWLSRFSIKKTFKRRNSLPQKLSGWQYNTQRLYKLVHDVS